MMRHLENLRAVLTASALAASSLAPAQTPCQPNLVPDGGFSATPSTWTKATTFGAISFPAAANVTGYGLSPAVQLTTGNSVVMEQTLSFPLVAGRTYEVSLDMRVLSLSGTHALYLRDSSGAYQRLFGLGTASTGRWRYANRFTVAASDAYRFALEMLVGDVEYDNVRIREANGAPLFNVTSTTRRTGVWSRWNVFGAPNQVVVVALGVLGLTVGAPVPGCGSVPLEFLPTTGPVVALGPVTLGTTGLFSSDSLTHFPVPPELAGVPLLWQPVALPLNGPCQIGCPEPIAF